VTRAIGITPDIRATSGSAGMRDRRDQRSRVAAPSRITPRAMAIQTSAIGPGVCPERCGLLLSDCPVAPARRLMAFHRGCLPSTDGDLGAGGGLPAPWLASGVSVSATSVRD
jgi:hypothetical protein